MRSVHTPWYKKPILQNNKYVNVQKGAMFASLFSLVSKSFAMCGHIEYSGPSESMNVGCFKGIGILASRDSRLTFSFFSILIVCTVFVHFYNRHRCI